MAWFLSRQLWHDHIASASASASGVGNGAIRAFDSCHDIWRPTVHMQPPLTWVHIWVIWICELQCLMQVVSRHVNHGLVEGSMTGVHLNLAWNHIGRFARKSISCQLGNRAVIKHDTTWNKSLIFRTRFRKGSWIEIRGVRPVTVCRLVAEKVRMEVLEFNRNTDPVSIFNESRQFNSPPNEIFGFEMHWNSPYRIRWYVT